VFQVSPGFASDRGSDMQNVLGLFSPNQSRKDAFEAIDRASGAARPYILAMIVGILESRAIASATLRPQEELAATSERPCRGHHDQITEAFCACA